jgi:hypothetical protein
LFSDIPAGDGKISNLFYSVNCTMNIAECTMRKRHIEERTQHRDNRDGWTGMDVNRTFEQLFDALSANMA